MRIYISEARKRRRGDESEDEGVGETLAEASEQGEKCRQHPKRPIGHHLFLELITLNYNSVFRLPVTQTMSLARLRGVATLQL